MSTKNILGGKRKLFFFLWDYIANVKHRVIIFYLGCVAKQLYFLEFIPAFTNTLHNTQ